MVFQKEQFELLAPGGDLESIKAAIAAGADAIYCGLERFNARNRASNITLDVLDSVLSLAHQHHCKIFLTLNIVLLESEIPAIVRLLDQLVETQIDGVIVQDLGLAYILKHHFPRLDVHGSTQMNTHNEGQIALLGQLGMSRVNLARELNIDEISQLALFGKQHNVLMEVFVHGSYCIGFSGLCYISSVRNGASGNRGRCSQPCRDQYQTTQAGKNYPLNLKDNSAFSDIEALAKAGVHSLKIEGRIKKSHYVYTVVDNWRKQIDHFCQTNDILTNTTELYTVFNRDFSNGYLQGNIHQEMFIDNPRDHAANHFSQIYKCRTPEQIQDVKTSLYQTKGKIMAHVEHVTEGMSIETNLKRNLKGNGRAMSIPMPQAKVTSLVPKDLADQTAEQSIPKLSVLIVESEDLALQDQHPDADFFYQLPDTLSYQLEEMVALFQQYPKLIPYFSAIMIGEHYHAARELLERVRPKMIVTNNLGIAQLAQELTIGWVAGAHLNVTNSFAIQCIQQELKGVGAFVSNELNYHQMKNITVPQGFKSFYSIYHPINLLTSRQCLFIQSVGCKKHKINAGCMKRCEKRASIINLQNRSYLINKQKGSHNSLFNNTNFLNLNVLNDLKELYTDVMIDMRSITTDTKINSDKSTLIALFMACLKGDEKARVQLMESITETTYSQYKKGL